MPFCARHPSSGAGPGESAPPRFIWVHVGSGRGPARYHRVPADPPGGVLGAQFLVDQVQQLLLVGNAELGVEMPDVPLHGARR